MVRREIRRRKNDQRPHTRRSVKGKKFNAGRGKVPTFSRKNLIRLKSITHIQFTHGDFDKDKTPNLDDKFPFDSNRNDPLDTDSKFIQEFDRIKRFKLKHNKPRIRIQSRVRTLLEDNKDVHVLSRLKTTPSIMNKLNRKYLNKIEDVAGVLVESDNKEALERAVKDIKKSGLKIKKVENFYSPKNKRPYYKSIHFDVEHRKKPVELQVKTIRQRQLHDKMHKGHKTGRDTGPFTLKQAIKEAQTKDFRDSNPPNSKRKLKRLMSLAEDPGSSDFEEPVI